MFAASRALKAHSRPGACSRRCSRVIETGLDCADRGTRFFPPPRRISGARANDPRGEVRALSLFRASSLLRARLISMFKCRGKNDEPGTMSESAPGNEPVRPENRCRTRHYLRRARSISPLGIRVICIRTGRGVERGAATQQEIECAREREAHGSSDAGSARTLNFKVPTSRSDGGFHRRLREV